MLHRDFVPWRFSNAGRISARLAHQRRRPKTCTEPDFMHRSKRQRYSDHLMGQPL